MDNNNTSKTKAISEPEIILASELLPTKIYIVPLHTRPAFPGVMLPMIFPSGPYAELFKSIIKNNKESNNVGLVMTKSENIPENPQEVIKNLHRVGTIARILRVNETPDGPVQVLFQCIKRFEILNLTLQDKIIVANVSFPVLQKEESDEIKALVVGIINTLRELVKHNPVYTQEIKMFLSHGSLDDPGLLADFAVNMTTADRNELQNILECMQLQSRLEKVLYLLRKEQDITELKEKITKQIEEKISKQQREFFLKEQLKAIKEELGLEKDEKTEEIEKFKKRIQKLVLPKEANKVIDEELEKLKLLSEHSPEYAVTRNYLDWLTLLPWGKTTKDKLNIQQARKILNKNHYGLKDVKERILEFIGVSKLKGSVEGSILCFIGPPGAGKTSLGKAIAEALNRKFFRFSLGGMRDEAEIKGHRRTYIGAMPGKIIQAIKNCEYQNPVIMLDEIDKVGTSFQGDPASALLEVLDPEQNSSFRDHYLDVPFDLSKVMFIATANIPDTIPAPLFDRMEVIRISGYTGKEKMEIAKRHLIPKLLKETGLTKNEVRFTEKAIKTIIEGYARESGVRSLEKAIRTCLRKIAANKAEEKKCVRSVTPQNVEKFLGQPVFRDDSMIKNSKPGVITGLAWTALGGATLFIESIAIPGKYGLQQTGQLGDVMKESSHIAFSFVTASISEFGIKKDFFNKHTIHLHVPAGATPKDGPSAGITMATSLISLALNRRGKDKLAMTGELSLTGQVLPVGGIKEKLLAAKRAEIKEVILPAANKKDYEELPDEIKEDLKIHFVEQYSEVFNIALSDS